jgi:hypothetical protein
MLKRIKCFRKPLTILAIAILASIIGLLLYFPTLAHPSFFAFHNKSPAYYKELSQACDLILLQHQLGTNLFIEVAVTDTSLPKIIRDLDPLEIRVQPLRAWILHGGSRNSV